MTVDLKDTYIYIGYKETGESVPSYFTVDHEIQWTKYSIKETDMRVKTASFTTPVQLDLTGGVHYVKIVSKLHENFMGEILSKDYKENTDGTYTYQCQDMSREYQGKFGAIFPGTRTNYRLIQSLLTRNKLKTNDKITKEWRKACKDLWSGLRKIGLYKGSLYHNPVSTNMMENKPRLFIKNKSYMEVIREICHGNGYVDVYFDEGIMQIEPISIKDWQQTGLRLAAGELSSREFKFDTTNAITDVVVESTDNDKLGTKYTSEQITGLNLSAFFGQQASEVSNPQQTTKSNSKSTTNATKNSASKKTTTNPDNPYGTKKKYLLIDGDGGEKVSFLNKIAEHVRKAGWKVDVDTNIGSGAHSRNYKRVKNGCYMSVYNGLCADTINEMPLSYYGGTIKKNGSVHCPAWDTHTWNEGNKPYKYSIEKLRNLKTAWDWNRGSTVGTVANPHKLMTSNGIKYCLGPTAYSIAQQFLAGGWVAYNKKK